MQYSHVARICEQSIVFYWKAFQLCKIIGVHSIGKKKNKLLASERFPWKIWLISKVVLEVKAPLQQGISMRKIYIATFVHNLEAKLSNAITSHTFVRKPFLRFFFEPICAFSPFWECSGVLQLGEEVEIAWASWVSTEPSTSGQSSAAPFTKALLCCTTYPSHDMRVVQSSCGSICLIQGLLTEGLFFQTLEVAFFFS